jgi:hypothetical protein
MTEANLLAHLAATAQCPLWVIFDRSSGLRLPVDVRFAPKATEMLRAAK